MTDDKRKLTTDVGAPVCDNQNSMTAGPRGPLLLQDVWFLEKLAHFDREVIPERRMHAKGSGAFGTFTVTHDITPYTKAKIFSQVGKKTDLFARFSTVAGERGAADAERDIRGFAVKFYTQMLDKVRQTPEWKAYIERTSQTDRFLTGDAWRYYVKNDAQRAAEVFKREGWLAQ